MKTALVHDWLVTYAGAERVLEQIFSLYPDADLYSLVDFLPEGGRDFILNKQVHTSFIQRLPLARRKYRSYLPLMPLAVERFDLSGYDLVLSSSHAVAKGVRTKPGQKHVCYCHTPMRYAWDLRDQYSRESDLHRGVKGLAARALLGYMKRWDLRTAKGVDHFIANSKYIAERIRRNYGRNAAVIYPPVDVESFSVETDKEDFYFVASRMVPYKKMDLIVEAFAQMPEKRLVVIGDGPDFEKIKSKAAKNVEFLGYQPTEILRDYMQRAKAFVFAADEDFGITPVEAQACGTPVIAYGKGGVLETVIENKTGIFFEEQTAGSLMEAIRAFERIENKFDLREIRKNADRFNIERFRREFKDFVEKCLSSPG
jgi:glycosyltransferase involved in cell wall biosynthesis